MVIKDFKSFSGRLSEGLDFHLKNSMTLMESVYRIESKSWLDLINEARILWVKEELDLSSDDILLISTDAGAKDLFEGQEILLDVPYELFESEYQGKDVEVNKPFRTRGAARKFAVYTKDGEGKVVMVRFGQPGMAVRNYNKKASKSFRARHRCATPGPRWKPRWWSCNVHRYYKLLGLKSGSPW